VLGRSAQISAGIVVKPDLYERVIRTALTLYKGTLSPFIGRQCRFTPTCSEYAAQVLIEHGPVQGSKLAFGRLCRCRPLAAWGYDPPPPGPRAGERFWKSEG
jgi:putative membrane protein insertion efficiency factor